MRNKKQSNSSGFTLIEILVVVAIIALLSSMALIALMNARQKSRDTKRLGDMTQMNTALELYYNTNRGYPSAPIAGVPGGMIPGYISSLPKSPNPPDGNCEVLTYPSPVPNGTAATNYYYYPSGTSYVINGITLYPDYGYYFCLGYKTGNFPAGLHILTPKALR